jgi:hypothetical protein
MGSALSPDGSRSRRRPIGGGRSLPRSRRASKRKAPRRPRRPLHRASRTRPPARCSGGGQTGARCLPRRSSSQLFGRSAPPFSERLFAANGNLPQQAFEGREQSPSVCAAGVMTAPRPPSGGCRFRGTILGRRLVLLCATKPTSSPTRFGIERVEVTSEHRTDQLRRHPFRPHGGVQSKPVKQSV